MQSLHPEVARGRSSLELVARAPGFATGPRRTARRTVRPRPGPPVKADRFSAPIRGADGTPVGRVFAYHDMSREI